MATTKATELGQFGSKLTVHNENITLDGTVHGQYAGFDSDINASSIGDLSDVDITTSTPSNNQSLIWDNANSKFVPGDSFSQSDFNTAFGNKSTNDLSEGSSNLYFTNARADARVALIVDAAPSTLDTLNELAAALGDDANFSTTVTNSIATKLPLAGGTITGDVSFTNGNKAVFGGTGNGELEIYAHATNNNVYISENGGSGNLNLGADNFNIYTNAFTKQVASFTAGSAKLLYDGNEKLATTATGIDVTGNATFADNGKAIFGAGSDLEVYHDGTDSRIAHTGTGHLLLSAQSFRLRNNALSQDLMQVNAGGNILLYHNGALKFATTATGIDVTGTTTTDQYLYVNSPNGTQLQLRSEDAYTTLGAGNRNLNISANRTIFLDDAFAEKMRINDDGNVGIGTTSPSSALNVVGANNSTLVEFDVGTGAKFNFGANSTSSYTTSFYIDNIGLDIGHNSDTRSLNLKTDSQDRLTILGDGDVGIGTISPQARFAISQASDLSLTNSDSQMRIEGNAYTAFFGLDATSFQIGQNSNFRSITFHSGSGMPERMRILPSGNVGIGTTNPATKLDVAGIIKVAENSNTAFYGGDYVRVFGSGQQYGFRNTGGTTKANISMSGNSYFNGGNVGIGITTPALQSGGTGLHIHGSSYSEIKLTNTTSGTGALNGVAFVTANNSFTLNNRSPGAMYFHTNNIRALTIQASQLVEFAGDIKLTDSKIAYFGVGNDLQIHSDGTNSFIKSPTGDLSIRSSDLLLQNANGTKYFEGKVDATHGTHVNLYQGGGIKLQTVSGGVYVSGDVALSGTVDGRDVAADGTKLDGIETAATADQTKADIEGLGIDVPAANLTGTIAAARLSTATTQAESDDSTKIATTAYVVDKITTLIGGAPSTLNDLNELAAAINDDANYNTTLTTALGTKLPKTGGTMTGTLEISGGAPIMKLAETGVTNNPVWWHVGDSGNYSIRLNNTGSYPFSIVTNSTNNAVDYIDMNYNTNFAAGIDVTGNITTTGTVDGVDIAARDAVLTSTTTTANAALPKAGGTVTGNIDITGTNAIRHSGDTNTYMQFHATDQWRVVTAGVERLEVNNNSMVVANTLNMNGHEIDMNNNNIVGVNRLTHEGDSNTYIEFHAADQFRVVVGGTERFESSSVGNILAGNTTFTGTLTTSGGGSKSLELGHGRTDSGYAYIDLVGDTTYSDYGLRFIRNSTGANAPSQILHRGTGSFDISAQENAIIKHSIAGTERLRTDGSGITVSGNLAVSGTVDGRDVATDGTKLDGIESGATADQTAAQILTAVKTVDGSGSGLDADLLDGQQGSYYMPASTTEINQSNQVSGSAFATTSSPGGVLEYQQASGLTDTKLAPGTDWYNSIRMGHGNPYSYYSNTIAVKMTGSTGVGDLYTQTISNNVAGGWNKHWHNNNDGSGSGLDADTVDGLQASSFLRSDANDGTTGNLSVGTTSTFTVGGTARLTLSASGVLLSAGASNSDMFYIRRQSAGNFAWQSYNDGNSGTIQLQPYGGSVGIGNTGPSERLHVSGNILATGNITANSDISLKDNITPIPNALDKVLQIRGVTFNRNDIEDNPRHAGVIAQEVEKVLPEVVSEGQDGIKSVAYGNMVGLLIEAIKEQQEQIDKLKEKLESK